MSNFAKKVLSVVSGLAVVATAVIPTGVSAAMTSLEAANELAGLGIIVDQSANTSAYRLADTITREELSKVISQLGELTVVDGDSIYQDTNFAPWSEKYAKALNEAGYAASNAYFNPKNNTSKVEAIKWVMEARDIASGSNSDWKAARVEGAVAAGIAMTFSDYDTDVTRGQVFIWAAEALNIAEDDDFLDDLLGGLDDDEDGTPTTPTTPNTVSGGLSISLSPETPTAATIPGGVNGLAVAAFDFTAGSEDVTVTQVSVKRVGLSDSETLDSIAVFTDAGRASNAKSDNQDNDTTAQINLNDGGVVVQAGETVTLKVVVDIPTLVSEPSIESDEFALELVSVVSNAGDVTGLGATSNTMRIGSVDAPTLTFSASSGVSDPQLGEEGADIFEFEVEGANDEDIILKSITFEGSSDAEDDLVNFELYLGNDLIATTAMMNDDYLTFDLGDGIVIEEDKNEDFTVKADIVEGAGDIIGFSIDEALDVTADSTKFGYGAAVDISAVNSSNAFGTITIEAGELTLVEIDAAFDEIREDKDNVVLGSIKVTNVAGQNLELQEFGVRVEIDAGTTGLLMGSDFFQDVELYSEDTGSSYELTINGADDLDLVYSEDNIDVIIPQGTTTWSIRVDTAENITNFDTASFELSFATAAVNSTNGGFYVEETDDDTQVTDITPSTLSFNSIDGSESGAEVSLVPLSDTDVVRGATDIVALQFEVEAEESSDITIEEMVVSVTAFGAAAATNQEISVVKLYEGSVLESNLLDQESGSNIAANGDVTFDDMGDFPIASNETQTFVVTVSFVDSIDAVNNSDYRVAIKSIDIEDDENDDVTATGGLPLTSAREITVNNAGTIVTLALDTANEDNEFDKLGLAGDAVVIASYDVRADNEEVDVETATFTITGATGLANTVINASLLLDGVVVATNSNSDISDTTIVFDDMTDLIIPTSTSELALQFNTANIGEDEVGVVQTGVQVTNVVLADAEGVESGKDLAPVDIVAQGGGSSKTLDIVTAIVTPASPSGFGTDDQNADLQLVVDGGDNTSAAGDSVQAELISLIIEASSVTVAGNITVFNSNGDAVSAATAVPLGNNDITVTLLAADSIGGDNETYRIETTAEGTFRLAKDGVTYSTNGVGSTTTKLENTIELGQYANSN